MYVPNTPSTLAAGAALTAAFTAEVKIETNDFWTSTPGVAVRPDRSWKKPFPPGTVAWVEKLAGTTVPAGNTHTGAPPGVLRNMGCVVYSATGEAVGALSIKPWITEERFKRKIRYNNKEWIKKN